jgi:hypothetical protein
MALFSEEEKKNFIFNERFAKSLSSYVEKGARSDNIFFWASKSSSLIQKYWLSINDEFYHYFYYIARMLQN